MAKRSVRPWDGTITASPGRKSKKHQQQQHWRKEMAFAKSVLDAPSVKVDGIKYFSDRFYLNWVDGDAISMGPSKHSTTRPTPDCICGSQNPPPLFSRERLLNSLDLKAAILGTFTLDLEWVEEVFPQLVGSKSTIPTFILHGDKKIRYWLEDATTPSSKKHATDEMSSSIMTDSEENENGLSGSQAFQLGKLCHLTQVLSAWKPTPNSKISKEKSNSTSSKGSKPNVTSDREWKRGVHHPKFMLLFEKNGNLVVLVSTANLTRSRTMEGTWLQRFMPNRRRRRMDRPRSPAELSASICQSNTTTNSSSQQSFRSERSRRDNECIDAAANDFGPVLQDFLSKLSEASAVQDQKEKSLEDFMAEHLQIELGTFAESFHFEKAQIYLVPVVPGNWKSGPPLNISAKKKAKAKTSSKRAPSFFYGRQRIQQILQQETILQSTEDRLILQPTSFGGNWKRGEMAQLVRSYLNYNESDTDCWDEEALLERMDIVWPSMNFLDSKQNLRARKVMGNDANEDMRFRTKDIVNGSSGKSGDSKQGPPNESSFVFMSSNTFNTCDWSCLSRMVQFESSNPPQRPGFLVPHIKSAARLLTCSPASIQTHDFLSTKVAQEYLSWFLLTSACLSHGAQGKTSTLIDGSSPISSTSVPSEVQYANFELGVLFLSRVQNKETRLYGFGPHQCSCVENSSLLKMIHLPIPYSLRPKSYFEDEDDSIMQETPFFHEIDASTRCVGNMLMTPYGVHLVERRKKEIKSCSKRSNKRSSGLENSDKQEHCV